MVLCIWSLEKKYIHIAVITRNGQKRIDTMVSSSSSKFRKLV